MDRSLITLATLPQATEQEVFDQVVTHMLTQMKRSVENNDGNRCRYRSPEGLKCAAGCLIGDDEYISDMEGCLWTGGKYGFPSEHEGIIQRLQYLHDGMSPDKWREELLQISIDRNLNFNPPTQ